MLIDLPNPNGRQILEKENNLYTDVLNKYSIKIR